MPMPSVLGGSYGGGRFLMGEVPLYSDSEHGARRAGVRERESEFKLPWRKAGLLKSSR